MADGKDTLLNAPAVQCRPVSKPLTKYAELANDRDSAILAAYRNGAYSLREIGDFFGLHYSRGSRIIHKMKTDDCEVSNEITYLFFSSAKQ